MKRYLIMAMRKPGFSQNIVQPHRDFLAQLRGQGILELAGGFTHAAGGAYMLRAENLEAAQAIVARDPLALVDASELIVYEWNAA